MAPFEPPAALPEGVRARPLVAADLAPAVLLSQEAGWNQTAADWRIFLELGAGIGLTDADGGLIATVATLPYGGRFAWISMVLVTARHRRRGLATWLLRQAIVTIRAQGLVPALDATPAGRLVYLGLDFRDAWSLRRLVLSERLRAPAIAAPAGNVIRALEAADWPALEAYDAAVFGAARGAFLRHLATRLPAAALVAARAGRIAGYLLGREGRVVSQLGPLAAEDEAIAQALVAGALAGVAAPLAIDIADRHRTLGAWLEQLGLVAERPWTRMVHGQDAAFDDAARLFAIAGPEFG